MIHRRERLVGFLPVAEARLRLGYGAPPSGRGARAMQEMGRVAQVLVHTACAYRRFGATELRESPFLAEVSAAVVGLVTIGPELERQVERLQDEGAIADALVLDAYGSAYVEAAANGAADLIRAEARRQGLRCSRRFSPGYAGWDVAEQDWVLHHLEAGALGVTLTSGGMLTPRKSVTFAMTVGRQPLELRCNGRCHDCDLPHCRHHDPGSRRAERRRPWCATSDPT